MGILRKQYAFRNYVGTYDVEVMDTKRLDDSLFLAKKCIIEFFRELLGMQFKIKNTRKISNYFS